MGRFFFGTLVLLPFLLVYGLGNNWPAGMDWLWIGLSAASIGLGVNMLYLGMQLKGAALAAAMLSIAPALSLTLEWILLDAEFCVSELSGMGIVLPGGCLLTRPALQRLNQ